MKAVPIATLWFLTGCAATGVVQQAGQPVADPSEFVGELRSETIPATPQRITFGWTLDEAGARVRGRGVVRVEAPERIRLDLFGPRGETYLTAALVDGQYRFPSSATPAVQLPSPALLWAALGVLHPPSGAALQAATTEQGRADVRFADAAGELFIYSFVMDGNDQYQLTRVERAGSRGVLETVTIERNDAGAIATARYRDWTAFRDLDLTVEEVRSESPFPATIWRPGAEAQ